MNNLLKQALTKGKPPKLPEDFMQHEMDGEYGQQMPECNEEGLSDDGRTLMFPPKTHGIANDKQYAASKWEDYFDSLEFMANGTPVYIAGGTSGPVFLCMHGAGDSACSFACLAKEIKQFGTLVSFDFRGHGLSKIESSDDLSIDTLISDSEAVFQYVRNKYPTLTIIILGHSMGGSVAAKLAEKLNAHNESKDIIKGLIVIDIVEGSAIEALPFMETIVSSRPYRFENIEGAIKWHTRTKLVKNIESARVSAPPKVKEITTDGKSHFEWKVDLMKSEKHWLGWFKGLDSAFLGVPVPKMLMLAERERLDKELIIANMQGKFQLVVIQGVGHYIQEDNFKKTAFHLHQFVESFRIPTDQEDQKKFDELGLGSFHPNVKPYVEQ